MTKQRSEFGFAKKGDFPARQLDPATKSKPKSNDLRLRAASARKIASPSSPAKLATWGEPSAASGRASRATYHALEYWDLSRLRPSPRRTRTHNRKQLRKLAALIRKIGFIDPIIVDEHGVILSGHLRYEAAKVLQIDVAPVVQLRNLSDAEKRIYALAANRIAQDAGWDRETLALELGELAVVLEGDELELGDSGFEIAEIDAFALDHGENSDGEAENAIPDVQQGVSQPGQIWLLHKHRLLIGDARRTDDYTRLMNGQIAALVFTDPPYNVSIGSHARRQSNHREFTMASGEMTPAAFDDFLNAALGGMPIVWQRAASPMSVLTGDMCRRSKE